MRLRRACRVLIAACWALLGAAAWAGASTAEATERELIKAERAAAEAAYAQQVRDCSARFVVTACVDAARAQRHAALARLDERQLVLDDARRKERAAQRTQAIASKVDGEEAMRRDEAARERAAKSADSQEARPALPTASAPVSPSRAPAASSAAERSAQEARARRAFELKQVQAEAHRQEVARRNAERAHKTNPGAPLPTPSASAVSSP